MRAKEDLIYKEECYKIIGFIFEVFNEVGYGHKEKFYQKAVANIFTENGIIFKEQLKARVKFKGKEIGYYLFDFLVLDKIVIELKQKNYFSKKDIEQLYSYLKAVNLKLGILVYFTNDGIRYKRIVNLK
jgi:GxxExxY protein